MCGINVNCSIRDDHIGPCYVNGKNVPKRTKQNQETHEDILDAYSVPHYNKHPSGIECIKIVEHYNFNLGNVIKYVWRAGLKTTDPKEDLEKAKYYIEREIERLK